MPPSLCQRLRLGLPGHCGRPALRRSTLIELLVVIAIIAILAGLVLPAPVASLAGSVYGGRRNLP